MKRGNLYQNLRIEEQLKFKKLHYSNYMMGYRLPQYRRGLKLYGECKIFCNLDNDTCLLSFVEISFNIYYTTDDIRELCNKLDNISDTLSH